MNLEVVNFAVVLCCESRFLALDIETFACVVISEAKGASLAIEVAKTVAKEYSTAIVKYEGQLI
mgnify:CR=1 FL=1